MTQKHKWNTSWKFSEETNALVTSIESSFDVSDEAKRVLRLRVAASGKTLAYIVSLESSLEAGAGFFHPALIISPHKLDKRGDIIEKLEGLGIENPFDIIIG
jgi:hypothetical protein